MPCLEGITLQPPWKSQIVETTIGSSLLGRGRPTDTGLSYSYWLRRGGGPTQPALADRTPSIEKRMSFCGPALPNTVHPFLPSPHAIQHLSELLVLLLSGLKDAI